jgi:hypothetical protein
MPLALFRRSSEVADYCAKFRSRLPLFPHRK